jgi:hypothetical protein
LPSYSNVAASRLPIAASGQDTGYVLEPSMMHAVKVLAEAAEEETARLSPEDALDAIDLLREKLLQLQSRYRGAARPQRCTQPAGNPSSPQT